MNLAPWHQSVWDGLIPRLLRGQLPHALLFAGPAGLNKREFAEAFVCTVLCESRQQNRACGHCRSCKLNAAGSHPDRLLVTLEPRDDGKLRSDITVDQIRGLSQRFALTSQFGGYQCALIDPADAMNANAANALLKTLEEPTQASVIMLVSDQPERLPATIRSRCQRLNFALPAESVALEWLAEKGIDRTAGLRALAISEGNPGLALKLVQDDLLALREAIIVDLRALHENRASAHEAAVRWSKADPENRLWFCACLAKEEASSQALGRSGPLGLTNNVELTKLMQWFDQANRVRDSLRGPLRPELMLLELLHSWCTVNG